MNYGTLRNVMMGCLRDDKGTGKLTPMTVVIGKNGSGKSTLLDAFGFLSDCFKYGVEEACNRRNGFERIISQGVQETIGFEIFYKEEPDAQPITYFLKIALDEQSRPYIKNEWLQQFEEGQDKNGEFFFLNLSNGQGIAWIGERFKSKNILDLEGNLVNIDLADNRRLGVATLGALKQYPRISAFRQFIEGWYLSYFTPDAARNLPLAGPQKHLSIHGDNLGNFVQFMEREHPDRFKQILDDIASKIPGVDKISTESMPDNRLLLKFNDKNFKDPFFAQQMSDGTLKVFAYLLMLSDPEPPPFICIEEPENGLYHQLLETLAGQFRAHVADERNGSQIFITTHQPYFVNALEPNEVWILEKGITGFSTIRRASENHIVQGLVSEGLPLGGLWYSDYLEGD